MSVDNARETGEDEPSQELRDSNEIASDLNPIRSREPRDKFGLLYASMVLMGAGYLLPYNSFVTAVDYFHDKYPGTSIIFDITMTYILAAFGTVLLTSALVETLEMHKRILIGYIITLSALVFISVSEIWLDLFNDRVSYVIILSAVALTAFGCTVQQSSFYGYSSMLPKRFTQGLMTGESAAGFLTSINRILTKLFLKDEKVNTLIFFFLSIAMVLLSCFAHQLTKRTSFIYHYTWKCKSHKKATNDDEINGQISDDGGSNAQKMDSPATSEDDLLTNEGFEVDIIRLTQTESRHSKPKNYSTYKILSGLRKRWQVTKLIWQYMVSIGVAYFVTLCLFPGIETEIVSCHLGEWMPIILMALFNMFDFFGKLLAAIPFKWNAKRLMVASSSRVVIIPLMMMCALLKNGPPLLSHESWSILLSSCLGITNGYFGSVPMILAPLVIENSKKELAGNIMTLSYNFGLTVGSAVAYLLKTQLGSYVDNWCVDSSLSTTNPENSTYAIITNSSYF